MLLMSGGLSKSKIPGLCRDILVLVLIGQISGTAALAKKKPYMDMPIYQKLDMGAHPASNDASEPAAKTKDDTSSVLAPLTLDEANGQPADSKASGGSSAPGGPFLKSTVTVTGYVPKGPIDSGSQSIFSSASSVGATGDLTDRNGDEGQLLKQARNVNVLPLPLMESADETEAKIRCVLDAEKEQLADLWEATLTRSPDIQFVVQKLMPTSTPGRATTIMMRMLSSAVFGGLGAVNMMSPSPMMAGGTNVGATMISSVLQLQESKVARKARLSQTEQIMLYNMVRNTADKLVENYRSYKKTIGELQKALVDLADLQNMVAEAKQGKNAAQQIEMEYTIRKFQREIDSTSEDLKRYRQALNDLAGAEAVAKLDQQLDVEKNTLFETTPTTQTASSENGPAM